MTQAELIERLAERLRHPDALPVSVALWDAGDIAAYLKRTADTVRRNVVVLPTFPKPGKLPLSDNPRPLWKAREVVAWAEKYLWK